MRFYDTFVQVIMWYITFRNFNQPYYKALHSMTHSDVYAQDIALHHCTSTVSHSFSSYKYQGINAVGKCRYVNSDVENRVGHSNHDSGSSRYFNIVDFDGSCTSDSGVKTLVASLTEI